MRIISVFLLFFVVLEASTSYEKGRDLYVKKACYSCHGHKLEGMNTFPYLANRAKGYMAYKLKRFRSKQADTQAQEMMITYSVDLSDEDIENLAIYMQDFVNEESEERYDDSFETHGHGGS